MLDKLSITKAHSSPFELSRQEFQQFQFLWSRVLQKNCFISLKFPNLTCIRVFSFCRVCSKHSFFIRHNFQFSGLITSLTLSNTAFPIGFISIVSLFSIIYFNFYHFLLLAFEFLFSFSECFESLNYPSLLMQTFNAMNLSCNNFPHALQVLIYCGFLFIHSHNQHSFFRILTQFLKLELLFVSVLKFLSLFLLLFSSLIPLQSQKISCIVSILLNFCRSFLVHLYILYFQLTCLEDVFYY